MKKTVSVAPMMDCTDKHEIYFLSLISKNIQLYSEMIVANAIIRGDRNKLLSFNKITNPDISNIIAAENPILWLSVKKVTVLTSKGPKKEVNLPDVANKPNPLP